jgi:hypothetical protein
MNRFKECSLCGKQWKTREDFLSDREVVLTKYQARFEELKLGLFLFQHSCGANLALTAGRFTDLYDGEAFTENLKGSETCPTYCLNEQEFKTCPNKCECAFVREVLSIIDNWKKVAA